MKRKYASIITLMFACSGVFFNWGSARGQQTNKTDQPIAIVDGRPITEKDIAVRKETEEKVFEREHGRKPTPQELEKAIDHAKQLRLSSKIQSIVRKEVMEDFAITVTKEEIDAELEKIYPGLREKPETVLEKENADNQQIALALKEALDHPNEEKATYQKYMKDRLEYETWQALVKRYNTKEKIAQIEKAIPTKTEDMYSGAEKSIRDSLSDRKLRTALLKDITVSDEEVKKKYETRYSALVDKPPFDAEKEELREQLLRSKQSKEEERWWSDRYKKVKVEMNGKTMDALTAFGVIQN